MKKKMLGKSANSVINDLKRLRVMEYEEIKDTCVEIFELADKLVNKESRLKTGGTQFKKAQ